jgi:hypothetical protein
MCENKTAARMRFPSIETALSGIQICCVMLCLSEFVFSSGISNNSFENKDTSQILREIYLEMKDFDKYPGCDFVKREFFVGEDDDDTNKDIHVVILIQDVDEKEKVTVQVTYMERRRGKPVVGIAKYIKIFSYFVRGDQKEIIRNDFDAKEEERVLSGVLKAIKNKKKLLREIR